MTPTRPAIAGSAITAIALGVVGLLIVIIMFPGAKLLGAIIGAAAIVVGVLAVVNARRTGAPALPAIIGAALGAAAVAWLIVFAIAS